MRLAHLCVVCLMLLPTSAMAEASAGNWVGVGSGIGYSSITPRTGVPVSLQYGHRWGASNVWLTVQADVLLNAERPMGMWMKGSAGGLEVGAEWHHGGSLDHAHLYCGATVGPRVYAAPGAGLVAHAVLGGHLPVRNWLSAFVQGRVGLGKARVGDDYPKTESDVTAAATAGLRLPF